MKVPLCLLFVFLIFLFLYPKEIGLFLNEPLGIIITVILLIYFTLHHPIMGIVFILFILFTRNTSGPLNITYKSVKQTPVSPMVEKPLYSTGLEQLNKEMNLRSKDSNRYSLVQGSSSSCTEGDMLCLYENIPKAFDEDYANKKNIL